MLEGKKAGVITIDAAEPVRAAIQLMADHFIGALPVLEAGRLAGIVSERDYARKVVLMGRKSTETTVGTIMSAPVIHVGPAQTVNDCMKLMTEKRIRHLPVVENGALVGVISIGDCVKAVIDEQKHEIEDLGGTSRAETRSWFAFARPGTSGRARPIKTSTCTVAYQLPVFGIDFQGSAGGRAPPFCRSSMEMLSGERTKAMRPSRGGRLMVTPPARSFSHSA